MSNCKILYVNDKKFDLDQLDNIMKKHIISAAPKVVPLVNTKHRLINTVIPAIGTVNILADLEKYESRSMHGQLPIVWKKADDFYIFDIADNSIFLDGETKTLLDYGSPSHLKNNSVHEGVRSFLRRGNPVK